MCAHHNPRGKNMSAPTETKSKTGEACWFEIPSTDLDRSQKFYETVLGIKMMKTEKSDDQPNDVVWFKSFDSEGVFGHIYPGKPAKEGEGNTIHLTSEDKLEDVMPRVETAGGKVVSPIIPIPAGRFVYITDPDGNSIGLFNVN